MDNNINWEERRFLAAAIILSGMCAGAQSSAALLTYRAEHALKMASYLVGACKELASKESDGSKVSE